jgi:hypothetical protein
MAAIAAERIVRRFELARFVVIRRPRISGAVRRGLIAGRVPQPEIVAPDLIAMAIEAIGRWRK